MFVYGGQGRINVLLGESELEIIKASFSGAVFKGELYAKVVALEKTIRRAIETNGDIIVSVSGKDNADACGNSREKAFSVLELLFKRAGASFEINRIRII